MRPSTGRYECRHHGWPTVVVGMRIRRYDSLPERWRRLRAVADKLEPTVSKHAGQCITIFNGRTQPPDLAHRLPRRMRPQRCETARRPGAGTLPALERQPRRPPGLGTASARRIEPARITPPPARLPRTATPAISMPFHRTSDYLRSNCRPSAFQELYHPESTYLENAPTAQLTRIDAADRLFSVPLTRITSVPECAVSSVGLLWGSAAVSPTCGGSEGLPEAPGRPDTGAGYRKLARLMVPFRVTQRHRRVLPA